VQTIGSAPIDVGRRVHLAAVREGSEYRFFVDGNPTGIKTFSQPLVASPRPFNIGTGFTGVINAARISTVARYTGIFTPPDTLDADSDTLAVYRFDEGSGTTLRDSSGNGHNGTIIDATWVKADGAPLAGGGSTALPSLVYDGHRYRWVRAEITWNEAKRQAEAMNGHLAAVTSDEEFRWLGTTLLADLPQEKIVWIGGANSNRNWTWLNGEPWGFTAWNVGEPNEQIESAVAILNSEQNGWVWGDWRRDVLAPAMSGSTKGDIRVRGFVVEWDDAAER
jgi:hypothetical protein